MQVCSLTIEYQVFHHVPSTSISEQFVSILVTILLQIHFFLCKVVVIDAWSGYFVEFLSRLVCQLTISLHTFLHVTFHVMGPRTNTNILGVWKFSSSSRGNSRFKHGSVIVHNIFDYFTLSLSSAQVFMIQERCWFSLS